MATDTVTIEQFINDNGITLTAVKTDRNPNMADSRDMDHWKVTLKRGRARMTLVFSMGYGHKGASPEARDVLDCLASDASGIDNSRGFEDWCANYGYDTDSRKAEKTYNAIRHQASRLETFLGDSDLYQQLLYQTERL